MSDFPLAEVVSWWQERRPALSHDQNDRVIGDDGKERGRSRGLCTPVCLMESFRSERNGRKRHERDDRATKQMVAAVVEAVAVAEVAAVGRVLM